MHRARFGLAEHIEHWYISGELGVRKPEPSAYAVVRDGLGVDASHCTFVDDRARNVDAAIMAGMRGIHLGSPEHPTIGALVEAL